MDKKKPEKDELEEDEAPPFTFKRKSTEDIDQPTPIESGTTKDDEDQEEKDKPDDEIEDLDGPKTAKKFQEVDQDEEADEKVFVKEDSDEEKEIGMKMAGEHTLDDLADEDIDKDSADTKSSSKSYFEENESNIPNLRSVSSQIPSTGFYSSHTQKRGSNIFQFLVLGLIGLGVIAAAIYLLKGNFNFIAGDQAKLEDQSKIESPITQTPTPEPTPTPIAVDRSLYTVRVLNGTSQSGLAASVSASLKELGYKTEKSKNATNSAFSQTIVRIKEEKELFNQLVQDLKGQFEAIEGPVLKSSDSSDAEIILGIN